MRSLLPFMFCIACGAGAIAPALRASNLVLPPLSSAQTAIYTRVTSVRRGDSEPRILNALALEYGERILGEPRGGAGRLAILTPWATRLAALGVLVYFLSRLHSRPRSISDYTGPLPEIPGSEL